MRIYTKKISNICYVWDVRNNGERMTDRNSFGHFDEKIHILPVRMYYEDTDFSGVVYHANYVKFMDRGRSEFFRALGLLTLAGPELSDPMVWAVHRLEIEYFRPATMDDLVEVRTEIASLTGARITVEQNLFREEVRLARGLVEVCMMTLDGKLRRIPREYRERLLPLVAIDVNGKL